MNDTPPIDRSATLRRILLTVLIVAGGLLLLVLPWTMLFSAPERYAGLAAVGVVLAVALHLFLTTRKRRQELEAMMETEERQAREDDESGGPTP